MCIHIVYIKETANWVCIQLNFFPLRNPFSFPKPWGAFAAQSKRSSRVQSSLGCQIERLAIKDWEADPIPNPSAMCGALGVSHTGSTKQQIFIFVSANFSPHLTVCFGKVTD